MAKVLVIVAHPAITSSMANSRWLAELRKYPEHFKVHELYQEYPDFQIDVAKEQALIEQHSALVLQFPIYWFSSPPLLKKWIDDVFSYGWAYGGGNKLQAKPIGLAVTTGATVDSYQGKDSLEAMLTPFRATIDYVAGKAITPFVVYGVGYGLTEQGLEQSANDYVQYLNSLLN
ncbi:NAD(P)H-dependent oxidoreductase [Entomomonas asaccharolytica]|uniref:NAD(P)H-dependent oxidoreductase n=1 Tax=Entomomonas asaccharolytica TaxID=2785331 RepID=A0A974NHJ5_9GAMM|nr:NAD(P)H-dependent oxidoreductase [Entomomonas asaccharolytica]QQP86667.1 NAD(P)H-dependent oxidoreductase [Entomomonas asaccharolytica]